MKYNHSSSIRCLFPSAWGFYSVPFPSSSSFLLLLLHLHVRLLSLFGFCVFAFCWCCCCWWCSHNSFLWLACCLFGSMFKSHLQLFRCKMATTTTTILRSFFSRLFYSTMDFNAKDSKMRVWVFLSRNKQQQQQSECLSNKIQFNSRNAQTVKIDENQRKNETRENIYTIPTK